MNISSLLVTSLGADRFNAKLLFLLSHKEVRKLGNTVS